MSVQEALEKLHDMAMQDQNLRERLLATRTGARPVSQLCQIASEVGVEISAIDLVMAGEESYAAMRRSTNGGGENAPLLKGEDDLYEMFLVELE